MNKGVILRPPSHRCVSSLAIVVRSVHMSTWAVFIDQNTFGELMKGDTKQTTVSSPVPFFDGKAPLDVVAGNEFTAVR